MRRRLDTPGGPMEILRTPDERFSSLAGYSFAPHYAEVGGLRMHYVDEGPADAPPVRMRRGEPAGTSVSRRMVPVIAGAGHRAIAPDLIGFGRSDKPAAIGDYSF